MEMNFLLLLLSLLEDTEAIIIDLTKQFNKAILTLFEEDEVKKNITYDTQYAFTKNLL